MSESAAATMDSTEAFGGSVGRDTSIDMDALAAGAGAMDRGRLAMGQAKREFAYASELSLSEESERGMAADAYGMAGAAAAARSQRGRAEKARERARTADGWESNAAGKEGILGQARAVWEENIAASAEMGGWTGDRAKWTHMHSSLHADIEYDRAKWAGLAGRASEMAAREEGRIELAAAAAKRAGAAAGLQWRGSGRGGGGPPVVPAAVKEWLDAMWSAELASEPDAPQNGDGQHGRSRAALFPPQGEANGTGPGAAATSA